MRRRKKKDEGMKQRKLEKLRERETDASVRPACRTAPHYTFLLPDQGSRLAEPSGADRTRLSEPTPAPRGSVHS